MIYHILPQARWQGQPADQPYRPESLEREGFIHCTKEHDLLAHVANAHYRATPGAFVILCIDESRVQVPLRWEETAGHTFPHLYGPLNLDAVVDVRALPRDVAGEFLLPTG